MLGINPELCILITNYNTSGFVELSLHAIGALTRRDCRVLITDNGSNARNLSKLKELEREYDFVKVFYRKCDKIGSWAHADALDFLISQSDSKYSIVLDSDCVPLLKGWDEYLVGMLGDKVKIAGSGMNEGRSGNKPADFPFQFLVIFETGIYKALGISSAPKDIINGQDTCCQWKPKFTGAGYEGKVLVSKCTRDFKNGPLRNVICTEYYTAGGELIGSHFARGSTGGLAKYKGRFIFSIPLISKAIIKYIARQEKNKWISICRKIIDAQT